MDTKKTPPRPIAVRHIPRIPQPQQQTMYVNKSPRPQLGRCQGYQGLRYHMQDALIEQGLSPDTAVFRPPVAKFAKKYYHEIQSIDNTKKHDFCFIGSLNADKLVTENRKWVPEFIKKYFTENSILINTDNPIDWVSMGTFDKTKEGLGFNPKKQPNNQSREVQYRKVDENRFYFETMRQSKYVLCPAGDALWSFRFYEVLMCGSLPIVESWHHTYRTAEESLIPYRYVLLDKTNNEIDLKEDEYETMINTNKELFELHHLFFYNNII